MRAVRRVGGAGLPKGSTLRSLRHSAASMWVAEGRPLTFVQTQLGHQSLGLTADTYTQAAVHGWRRGDSIEAAIGQARRRLPAKVLGVAVPGATDEGLGLF